MAQVECKVNVQIGAKISCWNDQRLCFVGTVQEIWILIS
jgi:hypothetical protein